MGSSRKKFSLRISSCASPNTPQYSARYGSTAARSSFPALRAAGENCNRNYSALHLAGLLSDGGVHSHNKHLYGLLQLAKRKGLEKVHVHGFLDGRVVPPSSGADYVEELVGKLREIGVGDIATVLGR